MEKRLEKNLYTQISADAALKIMETLRKEGYEDLPRKFQDLKGSTLVLTYQVPEPVKVRPNVGEAIDWDKHELRVGDRVEHPKLSIDGRPQGTVTITRLLKSCPGFLYIRPDGIEDSGQSNKTWIFRGGAKVRPTIGTKLDFEKHTLEIGDYIKQSVGGDNSIYRVVSNEVFNGPYNSNQACYRIEQVGNEDGEKTWAWLADFWTLTSAPKPPVVYPVVGQKVRWANERGDSCTGRVYKIKEDQFWFIVDEFTGYAGPKGCQSFLTKRDVENGSLKIIAD